MHYSVLIVRIVYALLEYIVDEIFAWAIVRILTLWSSNNKMVDFTRFLTIKLATEW